MSTKCKTSRIMAWLLTLCMVFTLLPMTAFAEEYLPYTERTAVTAVTATSSDTRFNFSPAAGSSMPGPLAPEGTFTPGNIGLSFGNLSVQVKNGSYWTYASGNFEAGKQYRYYLQLWREDNTATDRTRKLTESTTLTINGTAWTVKDTEYNVIGDAASGGEGYYDKLLFYSPEFIPGTASATVTSVTIDNACKDKTVDKGTSFNYTSTVTGSGEDYAAINWSVSGNISKSTRIDTAGRLSVALSETAEKLTVTATSAIDPSKYDSTTVTVGSDTYPPYSERTAVTAVTATTSDKRFDFSPAVGSPMPGKLSPKGTFTPDNIGLCFGDLSVQVKNGSYWTYASGNFEAGKQYRYYLQLRREDNTATDRTKKLTVTGSTTLTINGTAWTVKDTEYNVIGDEAFGGEGYYDMLLFYSPEFKPGAPKITTTSLPDGTVGTAYSQKLEATGVTPITWSDISSLCPPGLSLSGDTISGIPTTPGTYTNYAVMAENDSGIDTKVYSITINPAPIVPAITTASLADGTVGTAYSQKLTATGDAPITWQIDPAGPQLPEGLTLNSATGVISGIPTKISYRNMVVKAENNAGTATKILSITINAASVPLAFADSTDYDVPAGAAGTAIAEINVSGGVSGGVIPYTFSKESGPDWINVSADGRITGTRPASATAAANAIIKVTDSTPGTSVSKTIEINVGAVTAEIKSVKIDNLEMPVADGTPDEWATIVTDPAGAATIFNIKWYDKATDTEMSSTGTFQKDEEYYAKIRLQPFGKNFFDFTGTGSTYKGTMAVTGFTLAGGTGVNWTDGGAPSNNCMEIVTEPVTPTAPVTLTPITSVTVTGLEKPVGGAAADTKVTVTTIPADAAEDVSVKWRRENDGANWITEFESGISYEVYIDIDPKGGYTFNYKDATSKYGYTDTVQLPAGFTVSATADAGNWYGKTGDLSIMTEAMTADTPATYYDLTTSVSGGNGAISDGKTGLAANSSETVTFTPDTGYEIDKVTVNGTLTTVTGKSLTLTMDGNKDVVVTYKAKTTPPVATTYDLTTSVSGGHGTISAGKTGLAANSSETVTFTPDTDYEIAEVTVNGTPTAVTGNSLTLTMDGNKNVVVTYKAKTTPPVTTTYTVTFNANGGTCGTPSATTGSNGKLTSLPTATRSGSYSFKGWYTAASGGTKITTDTVFSANTTVYAQWTYTGGGSSGGGGVSYTYYTITASADKGGSISPNGSVSVREKTDKTFTITPNKDYVIADVIVDGKSVGAVKSYTFEDISKKHTIKATFALAGEHNNPQTGVDFDFTDVSEADWFYNDVVYVFEKGLMNGTSSTTFSPNMTTTRGMIVTVLYRQAGSPTVSGKCPFNDVKSGMYYETPITWAAANGIVKGYSADKFGSDDPITREQMAAILYRYAQYKGVDVSAKADLNLYKDAAKVSDWAKDAIAWTVQEGIFNGVGDSLLSPETQATRAQIAAILHRFCENIAK